MTLPVTAPPIVVAQTSGSEPPRVELRGISKHFGPTAALADVSMDLREERSTLWSGRTARARAPW